MKRALSFVLSILLVVLCGCQKKAQPGEDEKSSDIGYINGMWISYIELDNMINSGNFEENYNNVINFCKQLKITDIFLHTVPFCDAYYDSSVYPKRNKETTYNIDILKTAVYISHKNGIRIHAWINPYRVKTSDNDTATLDRDFSAYKWLCDDDPTNDKCVITTASGVYLNPAESEVRRMIINAVRELCTAYDIDGIHFDDYFYPTTDPEFDKESYNEYCKDNAFPLPLSDYRRAGVNALVSGVYTAIKFINKDIIFSISPAADISKNREAYYADIDAWCQSACVDFVIPQLYFGFSYPDKRFCFDVLLNEWKNLVLNTDTKLCIGIGAYKLGTVEGPDSEEWQNGEDIPAKQVEICMKDSEISGHVFYSFSSLFKESEPNKTAREKISAVIEDHNLS